MMSKLNTTAGIGLLFFLVTGLLHLTWSRAEGSGLLEATKQVLSSKEKDETALWVTEKTGEYLPLDVQFADETGKVVTLGEVIDRPTVLLPIYFFCPNICSRNLAHLAVALGSMSARPGVDYRVIALSFNDTENHEDAANAKRNYLKILPDDFPASAWLFLTGRSSEIKTVTEALGFRFEKLDDETFIHPAALMAISADGKIIRYVYGSFLAGDIDLAVSAAASGTPASSVRRLLSFCFNYDPHGKTSLFETVKIVVLVVFAIGLLVFFLYFKRKGRETGKVSNAERRTEQDTIT